MNRRTRRTLFATAVAAMALLAPAGTANAGLLSQSAGPCPAYASSKVFSNWLDASNYTLAPGGAFESASDLTFTGGAKIVSGNESSYVHGAGDKNSVLIPAGGYFEFPLAGGAVYNGAVEGIWTSATGSARCTELS